MHVSTPDIHNEHQRTCISVRLDIAHQCACKPVRLICTVYSTLLVARHLTLTGYSTTVHREPLGALAFDIRHPGTAFAATACRSVCVTSALSVSTSRMFFAPEHATPPLSC